MRTLHCRECGKPFQSRRPTALFCSAAHRGTFNTRRRDRGAELYDLVMSYRAGDLSSRDYAAALNKLIEAYESADSTARGNRRSWQSWSMAVMSMPMVYGNNGDGR